MGNEHEQLYCDTYFIVIATQVAVYLKNKMFLLAIRKHVEGTYWEKLM